MSEFVEPIICPFTVIVDTSEQAPFTYRGISADSEDFITEPPNPWTFEGLVANADKKHAPLAVNTMRRSLNTGDYSIEGCEDYITIERKSLGDAFSTFTHDRERWERELDRMRKIPCCHVVIEAGWDDISAGVMRTGGADVGKAVMRSIFAWAIRFPHVHWWPMPTREVAEATAFRLLEKFWEDDQWQLKELKKLSADSSGSSAGKRTSKAKSSVKINS